MKKKNKTDKPLNTKKIKKEIENFEELLQQSGVKKKDLAVELQSIIQDFIELCGEANLLFKGDDLSQRDKQSIVDSLNHVARKIDNIIDTNELLKEAIVKQESKRKKSSFSFFNKDGDTVVVSGLSVPINADKKGNDEINFALCLAENDLSYSDVKEAEGKIFTNKLFLRVKTDKIQDFYLKDNETNQSYVSITTGNLLDLPQSLMEGGIDSVILDFIGDLEVNVGDKDSRDKIDKFDDIRNKTLPSLKLTGEILTIAACLASPAAFVAAPAVVANAIVFTFSKFVKGIADTIETEKNKKDNINYTNSAYKKHKKAIDKFYKATEKAKENIIDDRLKDNAMVKAFDEFSALYSDVIPVQLFQQALEQNNITENTPVTNQQLFRIVLEELGMSNDMIDSLDKMAKSKIPSSNILATTLPFLKTNSRIQEQYDKAFLDGVIEILKIHKDVNNMNKNMDNKGGKSALMELALRLHFAGKDHVSGAITVQNECEIDSIISRYRDRGENLGTFEQNTKDINKKAKEILKKTASHEVIEETTKLQQAPIDSLIQMQGRFEKTVDAIETLSNQNRNDDAR